jgi:protein O-mannosyl-transferase
MTTTRLCKLLAAILLALTIAAYANSFHNSFHFDDSHTIVNNLYLRNIANLPLFFRDGTTSSSLPTNQSYRPVVTASLALDYWLGGGLDDTLYFHLSMFALFLLQGGLMYLLYLKLFGAAGRGGFAALAALLGAGAYLLHPANAETINYIISRSDSYSTLCILLALVLYLYAPSCRRWQLYLAPLALGILTKPIAGIFPFLLLGYLFLFEEKGSLTGLFSRQGGASLLAALKKGAPALLCTAGMLAFVKRMDPPSWVAGGASRFEYLITQPYVILKYFLSFFLPLSLSADTDLTPFTSVEDPRFGYGVLFLGALLLTCILTSRYERLRPVSFGLGWFLVTLVPTSLIPLAEVMNDHRVFLPYVGLMMASAWSLSLLVESARQRFPRSRSVPALSLSVLALLLVAGCYGTRQRCAVWSSEETLWRDVSEKSPQNGRGLMNYGLALMGKGDYVGAERYFLRALELTPNYWTLHTNMGVLCAATGRYQPAEAYFKEGIALQPRVPDPYFFYARFLKARERYPEAIANLGKCLQLSPAFLEGRYLLIGSYLSLGQLDRAAASAEETLRLVPGDARATALLENLRSGKSQAEIVAAAESSPGSAEYFLNLSLGHYRERAYAQCVAAAQRALELHPGWDLAYNNICSAYLALGNWDGAVAAGSQAVRCNPANTLAAANLARARARGRLPVALASTNPAAGRTAQELLDLSLSFYQAKEYRKSIEAAQLALARKPDYDAAFNNICAACNALGQWDKAIAAGEKALRLNPSSQLARNNLAWAKSQKAATEGAGK